MESKLEYIKFEKKEKEEEKIKLSVASYNQLGNSLGEEEHFKYVESKYLNSEYREKQNLKLIKSLKELDILIIVECDNYWKFWNKELTKIEYSSVYSKRPTFRNEDLNLKTGWNTSYKYDGISIFFKFKRFELIYEPITIMHTDNHDRITLICFLFDSISKKYIFIIGTHLYWNSNKIEDQLKELNETNLVLSQLIENYSKNLKIKYKIPIIFGGDFNNIPNSKVYKFIQNSFLKDLNYKMRSSYDIYNSKNIDIDYNKDTDDNEMNGNEELYGYKFEPLFTTLNFKRCETIDYIWYSEKEFKVIELLKIPNKEELTNENGPTNWIKSIDKEKFDLNEFENNNGIPNSKYSSDHVIIQSIFHFQ